MKRIKIIIKWTLVVIVLLVFFRMYRYEYIEGPRGFYVFDRLTTRVWQGHWVFGEVVEYDWKEQAAKLKEKLAAEHKKNRLDALLNEPVKQINRFNRLNDPNVSDLFLEEAQKLTETKSAAKDPWLEAAESAVLQE